MRIFVATPQYSWIRKYKSNQGQFYIWRCNDEKWGRSLFKVKNKSTWMMKKKTKNFWKNVANFLWNWNWAINSIVKDGMPRGSEETNCKLNEQTVKNLKRNESENMSSCSNSIHHHELFRTFCDFITNKTMNYWIKSYFQHRSQHLPKNMWTEMFAFSNKVIKFLWILR